LAGSSSPAGTIHDIGYQRYTGVRLGRAYATRSLYEHGVRTSFGLGRSAKAKIFPWFVIAVLLLIATILVAIRSETGTLQLSYVDFSQETSFLVLLFLAAVAPELVSRDLRSKVLPLYFSRPLRRTDYALAKLGALTTAVWLIIAVPLLLMFLGGAFSLHGAANIWNEFGDFLGGLVAAAIMAIVFSVLALLISSVMSRRMVAAATIVGVFLVTATVGGIIGTIVGGNGERIGRLIGPQLIVDSLNTWLLNGDPKHWGSFGYLYLGAAALIVAVCGLLLLVRYRKVAA
jgi:ABC-2 type transport system permease protein